jgi:hypothetical protein
MKNLKLFYYFIITILFVYVFVQFLSLKHTNNIYKFYTDYIMNKYCLIIYISLLFIILKYDTYTTVLLFILIIGPFRCSTKEYFYDSSNSTTTNKTTTQPNSQSPLYPSSTRPLQTVITTPSRDTLLLSTNLKSEAQEIDNIVNNNLNGVDDRFKIDDIKKDTILRQIKAQINFDPYKTNLSKDVIYEIYNKYFDNDVFVKLNAIDDDSKAYIASGNFNYVPKQDKVDYDLTTYSNLLKNTSFGINSQLDTGKGLN